MAAASSFFPSRRLVSCLRNSFDKARPATFPPGSSGRPRPVPGRDGAGSILPYPGAAPALPLRGATVVGDKAKRQDAASRFPFTVDRQGGADLSDSAPLSKIPPPLCRRWEGRGEGGIKQSARALRAIDRSPFTDDLQDAGRPFGLPSPGGRGRGRGNAAGFPIKGLSPIEFLWR